MAFCSRARASSSVKNSFVPRAFGRSSGVMSAFDHNPWRSGAPHGVFGLAPFAAAGLAPAFDEGAWAASVTAASDDTATATIA